MTINSTDFKECLGSFATGVTIATLYENENPFGVTINSFSSLSMSPPLILFCLDKNSSILDKFLNSKYFAINILSEEQEELSKKFSQINIKNWQETDYEKNSKAPIIKNTLSYMVCENINTHDEGDHIIFIGNIVKLQKTSNKKPLIYFQSKYNKIN